MNRLRVFRQLLRFTKHRVYVDLMMTLAKARLAGQKQLKPVVTFIILEKYERNFQENGKVNGQFNSDDGKTR